MPSYLEKYNIMVLETWRRSPGGENVNPLQYSCLENPMDRGAWQATFHGIAQSHIRLGDCKQVCVTSQGGPGTLLDKKML